MTAHEIHRARFVAALRRFWSAIVACVFTTNQADRRSRLLTLTPKGRALLGRAVPIWEEMHRKIEASLPERDPDRLRKTLRALA